MPSHQNEPGAQLLSQGVEQLFLLNESGTASAAHYLDLIIVGSGYGGAIAAATLAGTRKADGTPVTVCVLERGREYLPGAFPSGAAALPGHLRWSPAGAATAQGTPDGLFDFRFGPDINALLANGLGGGSLINAGVMLQPDADTITRLNIGSDDLQACYDDARALLDTPETNTIASHPRHAGGAYPLKYHALEQLAARMPAASQFGPVPISVAMNDGPNSAGVAMDACIGCGDCATGCNHNAKLSLDTNLLVKAQRQGAAIYTGATVLKLEPAADGWCLHTVYTDEQLRLRHPSAFKLHARKVILAAGTFGSTEILLRSRSDALVLPDTVGRQFSGNGDMLAVAYDYPSLANAVADDRVAPAARCVGPTITARIDTVGANGSRLCFEELAIPAALRRLFEEISTTTAVLHQMGRIDWSTHAPDGADPCVVSARAMSHSSILAVMGDDGAAGELELVGGADAGCGDGAIQVRWPALRDHRLFDEQIAAIPAEKDQRVLPNPAWRPLPADLEQMITAKRGPLTTVHPLGGCPMGSAVNLLGQLQFVPDKSPAPAGSLVVLDGSVVPGALGVNPALTIAALSLRAARGLRADWHWSAANAPATSAVPTTRARLGVPAGASTPLPTDIEVVERLSGEVVLRQSDGTAGDYVVELTLRYAARDVAELALPKDGVDVPLRRSQQVDPARSTVQVYERAAWLDWMKHREGWAESRPHAIAQSQLEGSLEFMQREASGPLRRMLRGGFAWLRNRGGRDAWNMARTQWKTRALFHPPETDPGFVVKLRRWVHDLCAVASRAGEVRRFDYRLCVGKAIIASDKIDLTPHAPIGGSKRLTYGCLSNPVTQLTELALTAFPAMRGKAILRLDTDFLVEENVPLLRIVGQQDQPSALLDLLGTGGFMARVFLSIHLWTFRKPDPPRQRTPQRLPGLVAGLPDPEITEVEVDRLADGSPVCARLTRYRRADTAMPPVVLIHGYSTSGTAFSHPKVNPNLAGHLWRQRRDVWVLDLRTSSGMPFARLPWRFEDAALADIPAAIGHVCRATGKEQVDLMSHCMGGAMTGMAVLADLDPGERFHGDRKLLPGRIRRLVLSQVGPLVVFTQANVFRAYLMNYIRSVLPRVHYSFRVEGEPTLGDELLDRLLAAIPYPRAELAIENPWWPFANTEFVGTRHRMDALYGRDFSLANVDRNILDNLDDFFGPLNLETVSQAVHFARRKTITNRAGRNVYVSREKLEQYWTFPTLSIHGEDNGLSSVATLERMHSVLRDAGCDIQTHRFPGFGHQDTWLGRDAIQVFEVVAAFLAQPDGSPASRQPASRTPIARIPSAGPIWIGQALCDPALPDRRPPGDLFSLMCDPVLVGAKFVVCVPVERKGARFVSVDGAHWGDPQAYAGWRASPDDDGWMRLRRHPDWIGPDGTLVLVIHDDSPVLDNRPPVDGSSFSAPIAVLDAQVNRLLSDAVAIGADQMPAAVIAAVDKVLADSDAGDLELGVLAPRRAPPDAGASVTFAVGSCQYPAGPLDRVPAYRSFARLERLLAGRDAPAFVVLAGDQIYSDASAGLFDPAALDDRYKLPYEKLFASYPVRRVLRQLPAYMMLDDHEISDNWAPRPDQAARDAHREGCESYRKYQRADDLPGPGMWYQFEVGRLRFFMADTRSERQARSLHNIGTAKIMREPQRDALLQWLDETRDGPKFIVTPAMMGLRRRALADAGDGEVARLRGDGWEGFPSSMHELLATICLRRIDNVVFLSGDEHISCDLTLTLSAEGGPAVKVRSIHASPLYAPYPFANSRPEDFMPLPDQFSFAWVDDAGNAVEITCAAQGRFIEGDGFALLTVAPDGTVQADFDRERPHAVAPPAPPVPSGWRQQQVAADARPTLEGAVAAVVAPAPY